MRYDRDIVKLAIWPYLEFDETVTVFHFHLVQIHLNLNIKMINQKFKTWRFHSANNH